MNQYSNLEEKQIAREKFVDHADNHLSNLSKDYCHEYWRIYNFAVLTRNSLLEHKKSILWNQLGIENIKKEAKRFSLFWLIAPFIFYGAAFFFNFGNQLILIITILGAVGYLSKFIVITNDDDRFFAKCSHSQLLYEMLQREWLLKGLSQKILDDFINQNIDYDKDFLSEEQIEDIRTKLQIVDSVLKIECMNIASNNNEIFYTDECRDFTINWLKV